LTAAFLKNSETQDAEVGALGYSSKGAEVSVV